MGRKEFSGSGQGGSGWLTTSSVSVMALVSILAVVAAYRVFAPSLSNDRSESPSNDAAEVEGPRPQRDRFEMGPYAESLVESGRLSGSPSEKVNTAMLLERELQINQSAPRMINPRLQLKEVNYKKGTQEFDYHFRVLDEILVSSSDKLDKTLQTKFCNQNDFLLMRENDVTVTWYYWNNNGQVVHRYTSMSCGY